ncbi:hypothetical protein [Brevundimonas sp.]|uniref:hypothetical protein n=1 Tax=Brevundimonas sp. TaxID=1871086 RepID=UPI002AC97E76|nr:hypothetical protein [Brevundimonas sp.]
MILGKRRWALRLLDAGGLSVRSVEGDAVLRVLLHQAKAPSNPGAGDKGKVITGAIGMISDLNALPDLTELGLSSVEAGYALAKLGSGVDQILDEQIASRGAQ